MVLRLHVVGPAFGLASADAECLAAITYLAYAVPPTEYELVATSPSGVPTLVRTLSLRMIAERSIVTGAFGPLLPIYKADTNKHADSLPALQDTTGSWITGFTSIVAYLSSARPNASRARPLTPAQQADSTAYTAFLTSTAAPLVALNLYVSSANWVATTRPALSALLPFPLAWTEPPALRRRMCAVAAHMGLADLNIDDEEKLQQSSTEGGFLKVPARLRTLRGGVRAALSREDTALFRLEAAGVECLGVLADLKVQPGGDLGEGRFFLGGEQPTALDCAAFGYLALMLVPEVPRPWLRDLMRRRYDSLCVFVDGVRDELFGGDVASLPWVKPQVEVEPWTMTRFARGVIEAAVPDDWLLGESSVRDEGKPWAGKRRSNGAVLLTALMNSVAGAGLVGCVLLYRHLAPFGSAYYRWELQRSRFGAAGAFFGI